MSSARSWPELNAFSEGSDLAGFVDVELRHTAERSVGGSTDLAVTPADDGVRLLPPGFPMVTHGIQGRMLVHIATPAAQSGGEPPARVRARFEPLVGSWRSENVEIPLALRGSMDGTGQGQLWVGGGGGFSAHDA